MCTPFRMTFKQLLQAEAIDVCQIDSVRCCDPSLPTFELIKAFLQCRMSSISEILAVLLMAAK